MQTSLEVKRHSWCIRICELVDLRDVLDIRLEIENNGTGITSRRILNTSL